MNAKEAPQSTPQALPAGLSDVALVDARTSAAAGSMGVSWWLDMVRQGKAPQPVIRQPRCTRWALADVRNFWIKRVAEADAESGAKLLATAKKASAAAQVKRKAKATPATAA